MTDTKIKKYFVRISGKTLGPFDLEQLRSLKSRGRFHENDEISEDRRTWLPASQLKRVFEDEAAGSRSSSAATFTEASPSAKEIEWFYVEGGEQQGPTTFKNLKVLAEQGRLTEQSLIWNRHMENWLPAGTQPGLFASRVPASKASHSPDAQVDKSIVFHTYFWNQFLNILKGFFSVGLTHRFMNLLANIGSWCLLLTMILSILMGVGLSVRAGLIVPLLIGLAGVIFISVMKYLALNAILLSDSLIARSSLKVSTTAPLKMISVLLLSGAILAPAYLLYRQYLSTELFSFYTMIESAIAVQTFLVLGLSGCLSLQTGVLNYTISPYLNVFQESLSQLKLGMRMLNKLSVVAYSACSLFSLVSLVVVLILLLVPHPEESDLDYFMRTLEWTILGRLQVLLAGLIPVLLLMALVVGNILFERRSDTEGGIRSESSG